MAQVVLVRPPSIARRFALTLDVTPPLSVATVAGALLAAGHGVRVVDAVGEAPTARWPSYRPGLVGAGLTVPEVVARVGDAALVGVSCMFSHEWPVVRELIAAIAAARPGVPIVCGGEHPSAAPEHALDDAPSLTACVLGEGDVTAVDLADAVDRGRDLATVPGLALRRGGRVVRTRARARVRDVDGLATPAWHLTPIERYLDGGYSFGVHRGRTMPLVATRGCPYRCTFCSSPQMWTTRYVTRDPRRVVDEVERYVREHRAESIDFYDLTAVVRKDWVVAFCKELLARRLGVTWQLPSGTRSEALDAEALGWMFRAGCRNVSYAPESGSARTLARIEKRVDLGRMLASMRAAVDAGLNVKANILVGFPGEGHDDLADTLRFVLAMARAGVHDVSVWTFSPYPGSALYDELRAAGVIGALDDDYFASLLSYADAASATSYSERVSSRALQSYRVAGMAGFYAARFAARPAELARAARRVVAGRYESRSEMSLANLLRRVRG